MTSKPKRKKSGARKFKSGDQKPSRRRIFLKNLFNKIGLIFLSILFSLVLAEVALRVVYGEKFSQRPGFFIGDKVLGWKPAANLDHTFFGPDYNIKVKTDGDGYRLGTLNEVGYEKELVLLFGDSFTFGWGVSNNETMASYLDEQVHRSSLGRMRVVNLGVGGYGTIQHVDRLRAFLENHTTSRIKCVIIQHCMNDSADNPKTIGYHAKTYQTVPKSGNNNWFHLINFSRYTVEKFKRRANRTDPESKQDSIRDPYLQDRLWSYERVGLRIGLPREVFVGRLKVRLEGVLSAADKNVAETLTRQSLTNLQKELLFSSFDYLNELLRREKRDEVKIFHMFLYTDPEWYAEQVTELLEKAGGTQDERVVVLGRVPGGEYEKPIHNLHSGGHYNPEFNEYWAASLLTLLKEHGVL